MACRGKEGGMDLCFINGLLRDDILYTGIFPSPSDIGWPIVHHGDFLTKVESRGVNGGGGGINA